MTNGHLQSQFVNLAASSTPAAGTVLPTEDRLIKSLRLAADPCVERAVDLQMTYASEGLDPKSLNTYFARNNIIMTGGSNAPTVNMMGGKR